MPTISLSPAPTPSADDLKERGPRLSVKLFRPTSSGAGAQAALTVDALIDTGARKTTIDADLASRLGLSKIGDAIIGGATGKAHTTQHDAEILLGNGLSITVKPLVYADLKKNAGEEMLLGRDVLVNCLVAYDGRTGVATISW